MIRNQSALRLCLLALTLTLLALPAMAGEQIKAKVTQVADGDSLVVAKGGGRLYKLQISGIDAPERGQDYGMEAYEFVRNLAKGQKVMITIVEMEGRSIVGHVSVNGQDIAASLVEAGLAWTTDGASSAELEKAEKAAKSKGEGLWASTNPTPPWQYRQSA